MRTKDWCSILALCAIGACATNGVDTLVDDAADVGGSVPNGDEPDTEVGAPDSAGAERDAVDAVAMPDSSVDDVGQGDLDSDSGPHPTRDTGGTDARGSDADAEPDLAETIELEVRVADESGVAIEGAMVVVDDGEVTTTGSGGFAALTLPDGAESLRVTISAEGVATVTRVVLVEAGRAHLDVILLATEVVSLDSGEISIVTDAGIGLELHGRFLDRHGSAVEGWVDATIAGAAVPPALRGLPEAPQPGVDVCLGADITFTQGAEPLTFDGNALLRWPLPSAWAESNFFSSLRFFDGEIEDWGGSLFVREGMVTASMDHFTTWSVLGGGPVGCIDIELTVNGAAPDRPINVIATPSSGRGAQMRMLSVSEIAEADVCFLLRDDSYTLVAESWTRSGDTFVGVAASASGVRPRPNSLCGRPCAEITLDLVAGDADSDGFDAGRGGDCDDGDSTVYPGATDPVDEAGVDSNCDGIDGVDADGDGAIAEAFGGNDCDDTRADVYPGRPDVGSLGAGDLGVDNDCDDSVDEDGDLDGDGFVSVAYGGRDCNDYDAGVHPGAAETPDNGLDEDCDGAGAGASNEGWVDLDRDGWLAPRDVPCVLGTSCDCNNGNGNVYPGAPERCDTYDNDCDGFIDDDDLDDDVDCGPG